MLLYYLVGKSRSVFIYLRLVVSRGRINDCQTGMQKDTQFGDKKLLRKSSTDRDLSH